MAKPHHGFADLRILVPPTMALLCFDSHWVESKFFLRAQVVRVVLGECAFMYYLTTMFKNSKTQRLGFPGTQHRAPVGPPRPTSAPHALKTGLHPQLPPTSHFKAVRALLIKKELGICRLTNCTRKILERV